MPLEQLYLHTSGFEMFYENSTKKKNYEIELQIFEWGWIPPVGEKKWWVCKLHRSIHSIYPQ